MNETCRLETLFVLTIVFAALSPVGQESAGAEPVQCLGEDSGTRTAATLSNAFCTAADRASPGLVTVYSLRGPRMTDPWRIREEAENGHTAAYSPADLRDEQGSGMVISREGLILTCQHVVASADAVFVVLPDGRKYEPVDIQEDPASDLALIRIDVPDELDTVELGDSDSLRIGDWVVSLANPYELKRSVSAGIISATDRWVPGTYHPLIQNDASTNPGSSGGALLNLQGEVVGVITGGFSTRREFQGIGLAISANTVKQVIKELGKSTPTQRAYLGCETQKLPPAIAKQLALPVAGGLYVKDVAKDSPAAKAGIKEGDVLTHFSGQAIDDTFRPEQLFDEPIAGNTYTFTFFRDGRSVEVDVQMGQPLIRNNVDATRSETHISYPSEHFDEFLGLGVDKFTTNAARQLHFPENIDGVLVTDVATGGLAYKEGVAAGMVVLRVNSHAIHDLNDYKRAMSTSLTAKPFLILLQSNKGKHLVVFND